MIYYPIGTNDVGGVPTDNFDIASQVMEKLLADGSAVLPNEVRSELNILNGDSNTETYQSWRVELLDSSSGASAAFYTEQLRYEDALKARAFGFPERSLLEGQYGTKAEAESHADAAIMGLEMRSRELTQVVSRHLLRDLIEWNFGEEWRNKIKLEANPLVDETKLLFLEIYRTFMKNPDILLATYDDFDLQRLYDTLGLPMLEEGTNYGNLDDLEQRQQETELDDDQRDDEATDTQGTDDEQPTNG